MAQYNREILVPYLRDVCTLEMLCAKLSRELAHENSIANDMARKANVKIVEPSYPLKPYYKVDSNQLREYVPILIIFGIIPLAIAAVLFHFFRWDIWFLELLLVLWGLFWSFIYTASIISLCGERNDRYNKDLNYYYEQKEANEQLRKQMPARARELAQQRKYVSTVQSRLQKARELRSELYSVNIIPSKYRNIQAAYYLYDFFSTGRENDLEKVIQTYLLDEIVQRLDKIIAQNEQIILNQRVQMALQEEQNKLAADRHREQLNMMARMEKNQELQADYQRMIAKNTAVTNFLIASEYLYNRNNRR